MVCYLENDSNLTNYDKFCVDAQRMVFQTTDKEEDFLFTCCEGIKINLRSMYYIRNKLADEVNTILAEIWYKFWKLHMHLALLKITMFPKLALWVDYMCIIMYFCSVEKLMIDSSKKYFITPESFIVCDLCMCMVNDIHTYNSSLLNPFISNYKYVQILFSFFLSWWTLNGAKNWNCHTKTEISVRLVQKANLFTFFGLIAITIARKKETKHGSLLCI